VRSLTLWALGGSTGENRPASPRAAFATAVGGPLAGLLLGGTALGTAAATDMTIAAEAAETPLALLAWPGAFAHAQSLVAAIEHARLVESRADSHLIWFGPDWPAIAETIRVFLTADLSPTPYRRPPMSLH